MSCLPRKAASRLKFPSFKSGAIRLSPTRIERGAFARGLIVKVSALIRYGSRDGFLLAPPSVTGKGWQEKQSNAALGSPHSLEDVARVLGEGSEEKLVLEIVADIERIER